MTAPLSPPPITGGRRPPTPTTAPTRNNKATRKANRNAAEDPALASARGIITAMLESWGISELGADVDRLLREGLDTNAIVLQLQQTDAYKARFAANEFRKAKGLPVLSPAEYIATESAYRQVMQSYGLPAGFYDDLQDYQNFLANDLSPNELNERAQLAQRTFLSADVETRTMFREFYGLTDGAGIAAILDPAKALPIVERMAQAAQMGGSAIRNGLEANRERLERYSDMGVTAGDAANAFAEIGRTGAAEQRIAERFGDTLTQAEQEEGSLLGTASAQRKRQRLADSELGLFRGQAGAGESALNRSSAGRI